MASIHSKDEIIAAFKELKALVSTEFMALPEEGFFSPQGENWSPAENLHHLIVSTKPIISGMNLPRLALFAFGTAKSSRTYDEVTDSYKAALNSGGKSPKSYHPKATPDKYDRASLISYWEKTMDGIIAATEKWTEAHLDKYRMPHPLIGKLTVREMLLFTHFHSNYHLNSVKERAA